MLEHGWPKPEIWPSALLRNAQNISRYKDLYGEKTIVSVAYECKRFQNYRNVKKGVARLSWVFLLFYVVSEPIHGRLMEFFWNWFALSERASIRRLQK